MPAQRSQKVAIFVHPSISHVNPLIQLANVLSSLNGHHFTFFTTASFIDLLKAKGAKGVRDHEWVAVQDGIGPEVLEGEDQFKSIPILFTKFPEGLKKMIRSGWFKEQKYDFAIVEHFSPAALEECQAIGLPAYCFVTCGVSALLNLLRFNTIFDWAPDFLFYAAWKVSEFSQNYLGGGFVPGDMSIMRPMLAANANNVCNSKALIINTFETLEGEAIKKLLSNPKTKHLSVIPVGPLATVENGVKSKISPPPTPEAAKILTFLDSHPPNSVIYLSMGTIARPDAAQILQFYLALKNSNRPFVWSLNETVRHLLPEDQITHSISTGLILSWVPQVTVLSHPSTSLFISHAGWNGTMETITAGVPMVCFPQFGDQHDNAALLQRQGVAVVVPKTVLGGRTVGEEELRVYIEKIAGPGGETYRRKMQDLRRVAEETAREGGAAWNHIRSFNM
ncbi:hypothetical protein HDV00_009251 [Rhizophlyctis rosea]|nr:hypothetical protein HDV00_009251 [Rhizophlyctis rosea]